MEICEQEFYWRVFWGSTPVKGEEYKTEQKEKVNYNAVATKGSANPTGISGAR